MELNNDNAELLQKTTEKQQKHTEWINQQFPTQNKALNFLKRINTTKYQNTENILKLKINIEQCFIETNKKLKLISKKFKKQSVVILIAACRHKEFYIYWKSNEIKKILTLEAHGQHFSEKDQYICEYIADFIAECLKDGNLGFHYKPDPIKTKIPIDELEDIHKLNLFLFASKSGNIKLIIHLLRYGMKPCEDLDTTAQKLALENQHFEVLLELLKANLPFPPQIKIEECPDNLQKFIKLSEQLHEKIEAKDKDGLDTILIQHPNLRYWYSLSNKSALKAALECKLIDIYSFLKSKNLELALHEKTDNIYDHLDRKEKMLLKTIHMEYIKSIPEKQIDILMTQTSIIHDDGDDKRKKKLIMEAYKKLNQDSRLSIILQVIAAIKEFLIIFDFGQKSTYNIDPMTSPNTKAVCYDSGRIIVSAKYLDDPEKQNEILAALIHELCHLAVLVTYENEFKSYFSNDQKAFDHFGEIFKLCKELMDHEPIIQSVFKDYPENEQHSELIVRPVHLIAFYFNNPVKLQQIIEIFANLFDYYINDVIPAMKNALPAIEGKLVLKPCQTYDQLSEINKEKVKNAVIKYKKVDVKICELFPENSDIYSKISHDHIAKFQIAWKKFNFKLPEFRYLEEELELKWPNLATNLKNKIMNYELNFQGKFVKYKDFDESYPDAFNDLESKEIISILDKNYIIVGEQFKSENKFYISRNFIYEDAKLLRFEYEYGHDYNDNSLTREGHVESRTKYINFENFTAKFFEKSIVDIMEIFKKIKSNIFYKAYFYNLNFEDFCFMHKSQDEIIMQVEKERILILSSEVGAGKTATFQQFTLEIKEKYPLRWVSYIDLQKYTKHYKVDEKADNAEKTLKLILDIDSDKKRLEARIFDKCFESGNLVLIWNGFDEICPTYNRFISSLIELIYTKTKNIQFICTRPLYSDHLYKTFKSRPWQLLPLDNNKKQEFLSNYFKILGKQNISEILNNIQKIINKLKFEKHSYAYNFENPLMLQLVAETYDEEMLFDFPLIYRIFKIFIKKKIDIWLEKSKTNQAMISKMILNGSLELIFQKYALLNEFRLFSTTTLGLKMRKLQIMQKDIPENLSIEEFSKIGVLFINGENNFEFPHKTFSEFFVAQYFIENFFDLKENVNNEEAQLRLELFFHIVKSHGDFQKVITDFMMSYLESSLKTKNFKATFKNLLQTKFKNVFFRMLDTNYPEIFHFLFKFFNKDHDLLISLLHIDENETFYTAIFNPIHFGLFTNPEQIKQLAQNYLSDEELQKFLNGKNQRGKILFGKKFYKLLNITKSNDTFNSELLSSSETIWEFIELIKQKLTKEEQKELFSTATNPKIYLFYNKIFTLADFLEYEKLWVNYQALLTPNELQNALGNAIVSYIEINPGDKKGHENFLNLFVKKVELLNINIYDMFSSHNILHKAHWDMHSFEILTNVLISHTKKEELIYTLSKDDSGDTNYNFYYKSMDEKDQFSDNEYSYFYYDFTPYKILHRAFTISNMPTYKLTKEIYNKYLSVSNIQDIILSSNVFIINVVERAEEENFKVFALYLKYIFNGNEQTLKQFLQKNIEPTDFTIFDYVEEFKNLPYSDPKWFKNLKVLRELYETL